MKSLILITVFFLAILSTSDVLAKTELLFSEGPIKLIKRDNTLIIKKDGDVASKIKNFPFSEKDGAYERITLSPDHTKIISANRNKGTLSIYDISNLNEPKVIVKNLYLKQAPGTLSGFRPNKFRFSENSQFLAIKDLKDTILINLSEIEASSTAVDYFHARLTHGASVIVDNKGALKPLNTDSFEKTPVKYQLPVTIAE